MKSGTITITIGEDGSQLIDINVPEISDEEAGKLCARLAKQMVMGLIKSNPEIDIDYEDALGGVINGFCEELQSGYEGFEVGRHLNG